MTTLSDEVPTQTDDLVRDAQRDSSFIDLRDGRLQTTSGSAPPDPISVQGPRRRLRIALVGTRGVPAAYGGFETAVEEVGRRLVARGHEVVVYCRGAQTRHSEYLGMHLVHLPAMRRKSLETLSHTAASVAHLVGHRRPDVAVVFNAANSPFLPALRARRVPVATHMDGLEWKRAKWGPVGQRYYRMAESLGVRWSDALIADAQGIADYYTAEFAAETELIAYGAPILTDPPADKLSTLGLKPGRFHVAVARFEPENHVDLVVDGYRRSSAEHPLVVVGDAPYANAHKAEIQALADGDPRVQLVGRVDDQALLDQLYAHAMTYVHGHSVGGTNPSLLRAMGARTAVLAYDVNFNRDVLGPHGRFFSDADMLAKHLELSEADAIDLSERSVGLQDRARQHYRWDDVTDAYEEMCVRLAEGSSIRGSVSGKRVAPAKVLLGA